MVHDLTSGKPTRLILGFVIPLALGNLFQQCFSLVDTIIVGKCIGVDALAAVGSTGSLNFLVIGLVTGACCGMGIPISQCFGAKDWKNLRRYVFNAVYICIFMAVVLTAVTCIFTRQMLVDMKTPANILEDAYRYIVTVFAGIAGIFLYQMSASVIRAMGDSRTPVFFLVLASVINIALDLIFILVFHMGVFGAALATVIAQTISGAACLYYIFRNLYMLRPEKGETALSRHHLYQLTVMGLPMGLQYTITAIGSVVLQSAVNSLGSSIVASVTAANKVSMFFTCILESLGTTMATYVGQNLGARKFARISTGMRSAVSIGIVYSILAFGILQLTQNFLVLLFVDATETAVITNAAVFLTWNSLFYILLNGVFVYRFALQGLGYSGFSMFAGLAEMIARSAMAFGLVPTIGYLGVCLASPVAWLAADLFLIPAFHLKLNRRIAALQEATSPIATTQPAETMP